MATIISCAALLLSLTVFIQNRRSGKRDLLLRVHDQLLGSHEQQHGRRMLFRMTEDGRQVKDLTEEEFSAINYALSQLNVLAYLHHKRYIPRRDAVELWGLTAARAWQAAETIGFIALRDSQNVAPVWPFFRAFAKHLYATDVRLRSPQAQLHSPDTPPLSG